MISAAAALATALLLTTATPATAGPPVEQANGATVKVKSWDIRVSRSGGVSPVLRAKVRDLPAGYHALYVNARFRVLTVCTTGKGRPVRGSHDWTTVTAGDRYYTITGEALTTWSPRGSEDFGMGPWPSQLLDEACDEGQRPRVLASRTLSASVEYGYASPDALSEDVRGPVTPMRARLIWPR